jgi:Zinc carboxypeptidase/Penicillin-insensitive murein endopeptidase
VLPLTKAALAVALAGVVCAGAAYPPVHWRRSTSIGLPYRDGRLVRGVQLPAQGRDFFTWDPILRRSPDRAWRRWGSDRLVRVLLHVVRKYRLAHRRAPRVGIGDLSRPHGGDFGPRYGGIGHASHQNGLDADVYYPRRDRRERAPTTVAQVDRPLAQSLVTGFVRAGAAAVFVGPSTGLRGPPGLVQPLVHHDNHLHVRIPPAFRRRRVLVGRSELGRPVRAVAIGDPVARRRILVVGCIHGTERAGTAVTRLLARSRPPRGVDLWVVPTLNPDGEARGTRQNARGVDLNRNFPAGWRSGGRRWDAEYPGPRPASEPETRAAMRLIRRMRPVVTIWFHQPAALVRAWGKSVPTARRYARLAGMRFRRLRWLHGTAPNWQNHRFHGTSSFVVELPTGRLSRVAAERQARAVLRLAK